MYRYGMNDFERVIEERDRYRDALGLLRGYVRFDSEAWSLINDALRPTGALDVSCPSCGRDRSELWGRSV